MTAVYRNSDEAARQRLAELGERRRQEIDALPEDFGGVYARRVARSVAGGVAIAGFVAMVVPMLGSILLEWLGGTRGAYESIRGWASATMITSWGVAALAYALSYRVARSG